MTQADSILAHLKRKGTITPQEALLQHSCMRLAARVWDLRNAGHNIVTDIVETSSGARVARYWLKGKK